ncbi:MAG: hypothetical protein AVDCRST_MAG35-3215, partial [uncultured Quadrisphaera sp.]
MTRWTDWMLGHRVVVVLAWVVIAVTGGVLAPRTVEALTYDFDLPGQPAYEANQLITEQFGTAGQYDPLVLVAAPGAGTLDDPAVAASLEEQVARVAAAAPGTRYVSPGTGGGEALVAPDGSTAVALLYPPVVPGPEPYLAAQPALEAAAARSDVAGAPLALTGTTVVAEGSSGSDRGVLVEILLGGTGALVVLVLVFGSLLAAVPLVVAAVSILATFLCLLGLTAVTDVSFVVQYLVALIGLGVAIDYSLLIVMRWREERSHGADSATAVRLAMATAGRSVLFSGITVTISLAALVAVPLPFLRSIGLGGLLIPLLSVATALTLVPVLLASVGVRLQWPRRAPTDPTSAAWARLATAVTRRPVLVTALTTAALLALAAPLVGLHLGSPQLSAYDETTPAGAAAQRVTDSGIVAGALRPSQLLLPPAAAGAVDDLAASPGTAAVLAPSGEGWAGSAGRLVLALSADDPATTAGAEAVRALRATAAALPGADGRVQVGGSPAEDADFVTAVYSDSPYVIAGIVVITFLLLARALRSLWLPLKALALNVVSLAAAYGITVLVWQGGYGTELLFGTSASGAITTWVPIAVFAFLFGLSMDYEVFILSRMREAHDAGADTPRAVVEGIASTGRLVTSAALILFFAFVALSTVPAIEVKILATALALGIAIDALIVRALLAPALVVLLGEANWILPAPLARALRVQGPAPHAAAPRRRGHELVQES